ncbi:MAG: VOC family protein [Microthrixaceae bacterium]
MTTRTTPPAGAPVWADLWTSDVERARSFYGELFGWEAEEPNPEFGGYFQFHYQGSPIAGGMGDMPDVPAQNVWTTYFHTNDIDRVANATSDNGGIPLFEPMAVADLGKQFQFTDPQGGGAGVWEPGTFSGFATIGEPNTPSWFELHTRDHASATAFYANVFGWDYDKVSDVDEFRYWMVKDPTGGEGLAGLMDNHNDLPEGAPAYWQIYWEVADVDATVTTALANGAAVTHPAEDTPYGRLAVLSDPMGAAFSLRTSPA